MNKIIVNNKPPKPIVNLLNKIGALEVTVKQASKYSDERTEKEIKKRKHFWPEVEDDDLWLRTQKDKIKGFTTIPRGLPYIYQAMDYLSNHKPLSATYFALWCRVFDTGLVTIENQKDLAYESGFNGQRAETTWGLRMKKLSELGFIKIHYKPSGDMDYVLLMNPYKVVKKLHEEGKHTIDSAIYDALYCRAEQVGALDLD
jgi:hypothetical protein